MKITVGKRLISGFLFVSFLVFVAGAVGIVMVGNVADSSRHVIDEKMPIKDASFEAVMALERSVSLSMKYLDSIDKDELKTLRGAIENASTEFEELTFKLMIKLMNYSHSFCIFGKRNSFFQSRITSANYNDILICKKITITGCTERYPQTLKLSF